MRISDWSSDVCSSDLADTGIVTALGHHVDLFALRADAAARDEDRTRRLDGEAGDEVLAGRNAAEHAAGVVGEEAYPLARVAAPFVAAPFVAEAHLVVRILAAHGGGGEAVADLDPLDRVDAHQRGGQIGVELAVDRLAQDRKSKRLNSRH